MIVYWYVGLFIRASYVICIFYGGGGKASPHRMGSVPDDNLEMCMCLYIYIYIYIYIYGCMSCSAAEFAVRIAYTNRAVSISEDSSEWRMNL